MKLNYFNFKKIGDKMLLTNDFGRYAVVTQNDFLDLLNKKIDINSETGKLLLKEHMIYSDSNLSYSNAEMWNIRNAKQHLLSSTSLHIFVVTTACNVGCAYCQANNGNDCSGKFMTKEIAERAVDIALQSPSYYLNFEFQGGEPLLNWNIVKHIVKYAELHKGMHEISYNIVTNLTLITDEILNYMIEHKFGISTSLDGPIDVHNTNRPFKNGEGTYSSVIAGIQKVQSRGVRIGAIQTTTRKSLKYPREIVQTYKKLGFDSIFIRPLTPLGKASLNWNEIGYSPEDYINFYRDALDEIIKINQSGTVFREDHTAILLKRIDGNYVNYMELRSPCGASIGQIAYYADGEIFTCDEGRMLHEMGDHTFRLGNVYESTYNDLISNSVCRTICASSILETIPTCCDCVYQPYCGTCPVLTYSLHHDIIEKEPRGYRCKIYSGMLDCIFDLLIKNSQETNILKSWSY